MRVLPLCTLSTQFGYAVLPVLTYENASEQILSESTVIAVGCIATHPILAKYAARGIITVPKAHEGYAIHVGKDAYGCVCDRLDDELFL